MTTAIDAKKYIAEEYKKCVISPQYFIRKYCYIQHPQRGRILFSLFDYQDTSIGDFEAFNFNIILKGRQIGISTAVACYALWMMLFHRDRNVLVIATKQETAKNLVSKVKFAFDQLPEWLQVTCTEKNKLSLKFRNGSQIKAVPASDDAGRSEALSLLILDEAAFIRNAEVIWTAALPTLSTGGKAVIISTPNGVGNFFHQKWSEAMQGIGVKQDETGNAQDFLLHPIKLDWRVHPERNQAWRDNIGKMQGERKARQEFDAEFIGSGNTVVDADLIEEIGKATSEPMEKRGIDHNLWIWKQPDYTRQYALVADVSRGDGTDFNAFHIFDIDSCEQVAEYKGKMGTTEYGHLMVEAATLFNDALLVIERENVGWASIQTVIDRGYKNLFYMSNDLQYVDVERNLTDYSKTQKNLKAGFGTTTRTRPLLINKLDTYMRERTVVINSIRVIEELRVFIWDKGKAQAMDGYNDDLVMSLSIALWVRDTALRIQQENTEVGRAMVSGIQRSQPTQGIYTPAHIGYDPFKMNIGGTPQAPNAEDYRWLLG
jgi:hypothetical protein